MTKPTLTDEQLRELIRQGKSRRWIRERYRCKTARHSKAYQEMARKGVAPQHELAREVPDGWKLKGISDMRTNPEGKPIWYKFDEDKERQHEMQLAAIAAMGESLERLPPVAGPRDVNDSLCNLYTLTDTHVGMLAWHKEGGADWDLRIAEDTLVAAFSAMMHGAPQAGTAVVNQLGDMIHFDSLEAKTPTHGFSLDADGRYAKVVETAIRIMRRIIDMALHQHEHVHLIIAEGNHDLSGSVWLRKMFAALYEHEPRLTVNDSELPFYVYQHGKTMLAFHHGHTKANHGLPLLFASQYPEMWGATTKRYAHTGHRHHVEEKEHSGMTVVQHPTLAARDAHASRNGYLAERQCMCITYHDERGKVSSYHVSPDMFDSRESA